MRILSAARGRAIPPDNTIVDLPVSKSYEDKGDRPLSMSEFEAVAPDSTYVMCGAGVFISYEAGSYGEELRELSVSRIERRGEYHYLLAYCHVARGPRLFRSDRILSLIDPATGEIHSSVHDWMDSVERPETSLLKVFRHDLMLMTYLARADGKVCSDELDRIEIHLDYLAIENDLKPPSRSEIERSVRRIAPEWIAASRACNSIRSQPSRAQSFWKALGRLVDSDGILHDDEHKLLVDVKQALRL